MIILTQILPTIIDQTPKIIYSPHIPIYSSPACAKTILKTGGSRLSNFTLISYYVPPKNKGDRCQPFF